MEKEIKEIFEKEKNLVNELVKSVRVFSDEFQKNVRVCDNRFGLYQKLKYARKHLENYIDEADKIMEQININDELI